MFKDLVGYEDILSGMKLLTNANKEFGDVAVHEISRANKSLEELKATAIDYHKVVTQSSAKQAVSIRDDVNKIATAYANQNAILKQNQSLVDTNNKVIEQMRERLEALQKEYDSLDDVEKKSIDRKKAIVKELTQSTRAVSALTSATETASRTVKAAENSFDALKQQTRDLKRQLDGLPDAYDKGTDKINQQNKAAVALNAQYQKNIASINAIERGQKNFRGNVGNYPQSESSSSLSVGSLAAGIGSKALGAAGAIAGIDSVLTGLQKAGEIILQYDSLDSALQVVSNDTALFTERQAMLQKVSDDLGQDLSVVEKTYTNLTASSKDTRLEGEATDKIFTAVTGTMGRLKRSGEDTEGALLAIGQMMSKGTVQSEELRGQLGERLPGAFNIAARALGVTTSKLGDMLKNGEVLAADFLPKFAAELERTFNPNHEQRVEGLAANLARLRNEAVEWVKSTNIGDSAGVFIGNITGMAKSVREFFSSAVSESTRNLAEQTQKVTDLEAALPGLLSRYDELKSKSKLSTDEQKELQTVVNNLVNLAPSAATGFDTYGNALDVNKDKVLGFAQAQRELNAELNKVAIKALQDQTTAGMQRADQTQTNLNRGTKQRSFNFLPYAFRSDNEKRQSTAKTEAERRSVPLTDNDRRDLADSLQKENKIIELSIAQRLQLGDKLTDVDKKYIDEGSNINLKRYKAVEGYNDKIAELDNKQAELYLKGDRESIKQREGVLKELKTYQDKKRAILSPTVGSNKQPEEKPGLTRSQQADINRQLQESLNKSKATTGDKLADLNSDHQAGLIDEQKFIEERLKITLDGLNKRAAILEKAGKKETDDYINIQKEKKKADTEYNRSQLQLDLKSNKSNTDKSLAGLDRQHSEGDLSDLSYVDKRHELLVAGIKRDQTTLREAGQEQTELYRATKTALEAEQSDYLDKRLSVEKKAWKDALQLTKESLGAIDKETAANYETELSKIHKFYNDQRNAIQLSVAQGKLSENEGNQRLGIVDQNELKDELTAYQNFVDKAKQLTHEFIANRIEQLKNWIAFSGASEKELAEAHKQIAALEKLQLESDAEDAINRQKAVADNGIAQSDKEYQAKKRNADKEKADRQEILALATKPVDGGFNIPGLQDSATAIMAIYSQISNHKEKLAARDKMTADERKADELQGLKDTAQAAATIGLSIINTNYQLQQQRTTQQLAEIDKREAYELESVGNNESAKAFIQKKYDAERKQIQKRQAEAERQRAMFEIAINTAVAVVKALPNIPLVIIVGALGAASLIATATQPLPQYFAGKNIDGITNDNYAGPALVGERGREIWQHDGVTKLVDKPSILNVGRKDIIYPNAMTEHLLQANSIALQADRQSLVGRQVAQGKEQYQVRQMAGAMNWDNFPIKALAKAIGEANKELPFTSHTFDGKGYTFAIVDEVKHQVLKDLNKSFSFKRR